MKHEEAVSIETVTNAEYFAAKSGRLWPNTDFSNRL